MRLIQILPLLGLLVAPLSAQERSVEREERTERRVVVPRGDVRIIIDDEDGHRGRVGFLGSEHGPLHLFSQSRYIGLDLTPLTPELREHFGVDRELGVMVSKVSVGEPAETAGVRVGDIIVGIDGQPVRGASDLSRAIQRKEEGESVSLELRRERAKREIDVAVKKREPRWTTRVRRGDGDDRPLVVLPEIEIGDFELDLDDLDIKGDWDGVLKLDDIRDVIEKLGAYFSSDEWRGRLERIEKLDFEEVEKKMRVVEERLQRLERDLDSADASRDPV